MGAVYAFLASLPHTVKLNILTQGKSLRCRQQFVIVFVVLIEVCLLGAAVSKQCQKLDPVLSKFCGYEHTAAFQHSAHFNSSLNAFHYVANLLGNCSEYSHLITCSLYLPRCEEDIPGPYLPCKRVCDEYAKSCGDNIIKKGFEWSVGMCQLLPESDDPKTTKGYLGRCFEPPNFKPTAGDAELKCYNLVEPLCQGLGYNKTFVSESTQRKYSNGLKYYIGNYTADAKCGELRREIVCAEFYAACKDNKIQYLCRNKCNKFFDTCKSPFFYGKDICIEFPEGNSSTSFCHQTHWPRSGNWPALSTTIPPPTTKTTAATTTTGTGRVTIATHLVENTKRPTSQPGTDEPVVAARSSKRKPTFITSIVVPLAIVLTAAIVLMAVLIYRKQKRAGQFRYERQLIYTANQPEDM